MLNRSLIHEGNKAIGLFVPGDVFRPKAFLEIKTGKKNRGKEIRYEW